MSDSTWRAVVAGGVTMLAVAWVATAQVAPRAGAAAPKAQAPALPPAAATVGTLRIAQAELEQRVQQALADYKGRTQTDVPPEIMPVVRRQVLEGLIRRDLLVLEAQRRGLQASEQEAEAQLRKDAFFQVNGKFDSIRYQQVRLQNPAVFANAIQTLRTNLAAQKLLKQLEADKGPPDAGLRAKARRELTRADVDYLAIRRSDFDGSYPEPRESEIVDYYRAHAADFQRQARGTLSVVFVDQPALSDSEAAIPAAVTAWNARMRLRADSILAGVKAGKKLEEVSAPLGGPRPNQVVVPGNFPGYWQGSAATERAVFAAAPGTVLPEPVPAKSGWLVVRVDQMELAHVAPLREVSRDIRARMRDERRQQAEDGDLRALYATVRDSLKTAAYQVRYAMADIATVDPGRPSPADLDRYYRSHLADYSSFSSKEGGVVVKPLDEVRDDVRARWSRDRRFELARSLAEELQDSWSRGRRNAALEQRLHARDVDPIVPGSPADTSDAGRVVGDSLLQRQGALGVGLARAGRGWVVFNIVAQVPDYVPTFEQARAELAGRARARRQRLDEEGARRLFDAKPQAFAAGNVVHYSRVLITPPNILTVALTRAEVERYYREHVEQYSSPELVSARHILISPRDRSAAADREARARADSVLEVLRAGADFAEVAQKITDDPATKENGGDLGAFGRGAMLPEFERAAFAMRPGDLSREPVRTPVGYHIIRVYDYKPLVTNPLPEVYSNVSSDAATEKADSLGRIRADSLWRTLKSAAQARAVMERLHLRVLSYEHSIGQRERAPDDVQPFFRKLEGVKPGQVYPGTQYYKGQGYAVAWVDSVTPPRTPTWDEAREKAVEAFRREAGQRAMDAKLAELDSLMGAGWTFDSLGAGWGGLLSTENHTPGGRLLGIGANGMLDTLVFGLKGDDGVPAGQLSQWIRPPAGALRVRVRKVYAPDANAITARIETDRNAETERGLVGYFEQLKKRYPVRILDRKLRNVLLPQPPTTTR